MITKTFTFDKKRYYVRAKTEAEAIKKMVLKQKDLEEGKIVVSGNMTVEKWAYQAVETYKTNQVEITRIKYLQRMKHCIIEHMGNMTLKSVKPMHCQNVLNLQIGKSKTQINEVCQTLNFIFQKAVENNLILSNPAKNIAKPKGTSTRRRSITEKEREHILLVCDKDKRFNLFLLMLFCGCRPSEARECQGLDIKQIDGEHVLHIRGTKTSNADRKVPLPDYVYNRIKDMPKFDFIAHNKDGNKFSIKNYYRLCKKFYRELNISMGCQMYRNELIPPYPLADDFVPYCLRHTYCTDLQKKGIDIRTAQYLMGHADISMTANIYTHADNSTILEAAAIMRGATVGATPKRSKTP